MGIKGGREGGRWKVRIKSGEGGRGRRGGKEREKEEWNTRKVGKKWRYGGCYHHIAHHKLSVDV